MGKPDSERCSGYSACAGHQVGGRVVGVSALVGIGREGGEDFGCRLLAAHCRAVRVISKVGAAGDVGYRRSGVGRPRCAVVGTGNVVLTGDNASAGDNGNADFVAGGKGGDIAAFRSACFGIVGCEVRGGYVDCRDAQLRVSTEFVVLRASSQKKD
ncbi:hypothetical protein FACS1894123_04650 [Bacteroidia bacterium]|nr:hypothetical protein FACS1894123_04650 [Bacteroidia bacterium]